ncbi:MAG: DUF72 domain-containing protein [Chitinophagaceae bacterium]|nr:DUF72 domain-containing protein [Chitinophagaceae bacterium]
MDFGKVATLNGIDFVLPPDHGLTDQMFTKLKPAGKPPDVYIGCAKWGREDWIGLLYPKGTKSKDFLSHYVKSFNTIELNTLFYHLQPKKVIEGWAATAGDDFRFCPKFSNTISHVHQLKNAGGDTDRFIDHMQSFGNKLGRSFLQLSESFDTGRAGIIMDYLASLPRDFQACLELRHPHWFRDDPAVSALFDLLVQLGIGTVITDTPGRRDCLHMKLTAPVAFIRFVGASLHPTDYTRIDSWAERIAQWIEKGLREVYFFIHQPEEKHSPRLCRYAIETFNKKCGIRLKAPRLLDEGALF